MIMILSKVKHLTILEKFFKSNALGFNFCNASFRRSLYTKNILLSRCIYKKSLNESSSEQPENKSTFGKIIELDDDFEMFRIDTPRKKRGKKKLNENSNDVIAKSNEETLEKEKEQEKENNLKEPDKKKFEFQTLGENNFDAKSNEETLEKEKEQEKENNLKEPDKKKFEFQTLGKNSGMLIAALSNLKTKKGRRRKEEIILEGKRLISDAITAGVVPLKIFFSRESDLEKLNLPENVSLYKVPYKSLMLWGDAVTSQGVLGVFKLPQSIVNKESTLPLTIICDNVRDPGNMGSMLRVIASLGCERVILTKGCVDIWDLKTLRSGGGAHFHISFTEDIEWPSIEKEIPEDTEVFLADLFSNKDNNLFSETSNNEGEGKSDLNFFKRKFELSANLPLHCYHSCNFEDKKTVIVIGGETAGLSRAAYEFAAARKGSRIFIPMSNKIDSLNNSVALGILAYEFKRQIDNLNGVGIHACTLKSDS